MTIVVAHASPPVAAGMAVALREEHPEHELAVVSTVAGLLAGADGADVCIIDITICRGNELRVAEELQARECRFVVIADAASPWHLKMLECGACAIVVQEDGLAGLTAAVTTALEGGLHVSPLLVGSVLRALIDRNRMEQQAADRFGELTERERDVLALLVDGADSKHIAEALVISPLTAKTHVNRVIRKLGVRSRVEAAALAAEHNFMSRMAER